MLQDLIEQQQQLNARQVEAGLRISAPQPTEEQRQIWTIFEQHCSRRGTRPFPAAPALVADFLGQVDNAHLERVCEAIVSIHDSVGLANPVATPLVRSILEKRARIKTPNSWTAADKQLFAALPPDIRSIIVRREQERDKSLRTAQNRLAAQRKQLEAAKPEKKATNDSTEA